MYAFVIQNPAGQIVERFSDVLAFDSRRVVNGIGSLTFSLASNHPAVARIAHLATVYLYRREPTQALAWTLENYGLVLQRRWSYPAAALAGGRLPAAGMPAAKMPHFTCTALHPNWLLSTRIVYWKAGTPGRSSFSDTPVETIAKTLVASNAAALSGAADGRERDGWNTLLPVFIQADAANGPTLDWHCAYHNLLNTLQRLAALSGADFDLVPLESGYEFRWYAAGLGSDRRTQLIFSTERGNIANPCYELDRRAEKTVAVVGGRGLGILRSTLHACADACSPANDIEGFTSSNQAESAAAMLSVANHYLAGHAAPARLTYDVIQIPSTYYGKHYFLGDWVTVRNPFTGQDFPARVQSTRITFQQPDAAHPAAAPFIQIDLGSETISAEAFPDLLEDLQTAESRSEDTLDAAVFDDAEAITIYLDAGTFSGAYLSPGVSGGFFRPPPG
jgi:hypothetical protein